MKTIERIQRIALGTFEVENPELTISDPCYSKGTWCSGILKKVKTGTWNSEVLIFNNSLTGWGQRNAELIAYHNDYTLKPKWSNTKIDVGVDSGQAGIFANYPDEPDDYSWYRKICNITLESKYSAGVISDGTVSSSGFGDGAYRCLVQRNSNKIVAVKIVFIDSVDIPSKENLDFSLNSQASDFTDCIPGFKLCDGSFNHDYSVTKDNYIYSKYFVCHCDQIMIYNEFLAFSKDYSTKKKAEAAWIKKYKIIAENTPVNPMVNDKRNK